MAEIIALSEGHFTVDKGKDFTPFHLGEDDLQNRSTGSLLVGIQPFLVKIKDELLLLDTGLGFENKDGELQIYKNLRAQHVQPEDITKVLLSHLHKDHTGGIGRKEKDGSRVLNFPNATYYVSEKELEFAFENEGASYHSGDFGILKDHPQVELCQEEGEIDGVIRYERSGGHSPFHQVFWMEDEEGISFFGGDEAPQLHQLKNRFMAKYDYDGRKSMELRQQYKEQGEKEGWTFMFYHDIDTPFVVLK